MTKLREIKVERCIFFLSFREHAFPLRPSMTQTNYTTPEEHKFGEGWFAAQEWVRGKISESLFVFDPKKPEELTKDAYEQLGWAPHVPPLNTIPLLDRFLKSQNGAINYQGLCFAIENYLVRLSLLLTRKAWTIIDARFNQFGEHNDSSLEVAVERRTHIRVIR